MVRGILGAAVMLLCAVALPEASWSADSSDPTSFIYPANDGTLGPISWTGLIISPDYGYDTLNFSGDGGRLLRDAKGWRIGGEVGYDYQVGSVVLGVAANASYSWLSSSESSAGLDARLNGFGSVRGRLGYAFGRLMVYGTGGWAWADLEVRDTSSGLRDENILNGWAAGGGAEYVWNKSITARIEYVHSDFGEETFDSLPTGAGKIGADIDIVKATWITRF